MKELRGNLHDIPCDVVCITTNGFVAKNGKAVMGRGCAKEIKNIHPGIDLILGSKLRELGLQPYILLQDKDGKDIVSFPVKPDFVTNEVDNIVQHARSKFKRGDQVPGYYAKADLEIIEQSARALRRMADFKPEWKTILVPRPGCGAGELDWSDVKPILEKYFDDRFTIVTFPHPENANYYAGIGARDTPAEVLEAMTEIAGWLEERGFILRSGGAEGADSAFEHGCSDSDIYLPWERYNGHRSEFKSPSEAAQEIASSVHWAWDNCKPAVHKLHGRNAEILLGKDLDKPVRFVIAWTQNGQDKGGTGVALRIARKYQIPIFNLGFGLEEGIEEIKRYVYENILETKVVNLYKESYDVYIGRASGNGESLWGNPFPVEKEEDREESIRKYEVYIREKLDSGKIPLFELRKLKGRRLGCFCKPKDCHGDVLVKLVSEYFPSPEF